jgi:hypothetical protein
VLRDPLFDFGNAPECIVPARLQFRGYEPIGGVDSVVLTEGAIGGVSRCLKITRESIADLIAPVRHFGLGRNSCGDRSWFDDLEDCRCNSIIDTQSAKRNATRLSVIEAASVTGIAWDAVLCARITEGQLAAAEAAANEPGEQHVTMLGCAVMSTRGNVLADDAADRLCALSIYEAFVSPGFQRQPFGSQFAAAAHGRATMARRDTSLTIRVGTA